MKSLFQILNSCSEEELLNHPIKCELPSLQIQSSSFYLIEQEHIEPKMIQVPIGPPPGNECIFVEDEGYVSTYHYSVCQEILLEELTVRFGCKVIKEISSETYIKFHLHDAYSKEEPYDNLPF